MATRKPDVGAAAGKPAKATRGKPGTSSMATRTGRSARSTVPAMSEPERKPDPGIVSSGLTATDPRQNLEALRDILAAALVAADPSVQAQIAGQLRAVYKDLAALPAEKKASKLDELAARRAASRPPDTTRRGAAARSEA